MNGSQRAVLWIGLILIALNLASKWSTIRDVIFSGGSGVGASPNGGSSGGSPGGIQLPWWIPKWPGTQIPLVSQTQQNAQTTPSSNQAGKKTQLV